MKKLLCLAIAMLLFSASAAFSKCTPEEFQKMLVEMQTSLQEISKKDASKLQELNKEMEALFTADLKELEGMTKDAASSQDATKAQALLDKSCVLYKKINEKINEYK